MVMTLCACQKYRMHKVCPEGFQLCNMKKWRHLLKKIQDTRKIVHTRQKMQDTRQWHLVPFKVGTLGPHTVPIAISCPVIFFWISLMVWNLFSFKGDFSFGKIQKSQGAKSELSGGHDAWAGILWWSCLSPVAHSCGLLNHPNSFCRGMFKLNAKFDVGWLLYSLSHLECDGHTVHMLTQQHLPSPLTSTVKSSLFTHAHSSPLFLATRLHWFHANHSHYIKNSWPFSGQASFYDTRKT